MKATDIHKILSTGMYKSEDLSSETDDYLVSLLDGERYSEDEYKIAVSAIFRTLYYKVSRKLSVSKKNRRLLEEIKRLLALDEELTTLLEYEVGLKVYRKAFRDAVCDGKLTDEENSYLDKISEFFQLRKKDIKKAISEQALAFYAFQLSESLKDGVLSEDEMARLTLTVKRFGLTKKQLNSLSVPNKKEILSTALAVIKSKGVIEDFDRSHIEHLCVFLNAKDLQAACVKDLDLYKRVFEIRKGVLPIEPSHELVLQRGENLHYRIPIEFRKKLGRKLKKLKGDLYLGSQRLRFVSLHKSHEIKYKNIFQINTSLTKPMKFSVSVSSGSGGGDYLPIKKVDPGFIFEIKEALEFLIRKSRGLEKRGAKDSRYINDEIRSEVWYRDDGKCVLCGAKDYLEFDHIIPHSKGGSTSIENLQILCRKCNSEKSDSI